MRKIIHIDMDCFFAAVEMRENPALRQVPLAIGGAADRRGVIATCNYVARRFGVRSAMATAHALRLCPGLLLLPGRMALYKQVSHELHGIFARYSDRIEPLSLDEAYLDVSDSPLWGGSATRIAQAIRRDIARELHLTASAGVASNKFLAKIASEQNKPDGLFVVAPDDAATFAAQLSLAKIPGIGQKSAERLAAAGLYQGKDVLAWPKAQLLQQFGRTGQMLWLRAQGLDDRPVETGRARKSVGVEHTYSTDLMAEAAALACLPALMQELYGRLQRYCVPERICRQGIKLKFADFQQTTVERSVQGWEPMLFTQLLQQAWQRGQGRGVRLVGVSVGLPDQQAERQLDLPF